MRKLRFDFHGYVRNGSNQYDWIYSSTYANSFEGAVHNLQYQEVKNHGDQYAGDEKIEINGEFVVYYQQGRTEVIGISSFGSLPIYKRDYNELDAFGIPTRDNLFKLNPDSAGLPNYGKLHAILDGKQFTREEFYYYYTGLTDEPEVYEVRDEKKGFIKNILSSVFHKSDRNDAIEIDEEGIYVYDAEDNIYWKDGIRGGKSLTHRPRD